MSSTKTSDKSNGEIENEAFDADVKPETQNEGEPPTHEDTTDLSGENTDEKLDEEKMTETDPIEKSAEAPMTPPEPVKTPKRRLVSLDTFRGFALCGMIFVNYGGGMYWFFEHAAWDGLTFADLMMPWFLFMAGVSIRFGILSRMKRNSKLGIVLECFIRGCKLWALGAFVMNNNSKWEKFRIPGVLQRIGVSYFIVSISHLGNLKINLIILFLNGYLRNKILNFKASPKTKQVPVRAIDEFILYWPEHLIAHALLGLIQYIFSIF